jgi:transposase-like protein
MNRIFAPGFGFGMLLGMDERIDGAGRWREILRRWDSSGLSIAAFCRRARVPVSSFYAWRRKLRAGGGRVVSGCAPEGFAEVRLTAEPGAVEPAAATGPGAIELHLPHGRRIVVRPGFDRATLLAVVDVLERSNAGPPMRAGLADQEAGA